MLIALKLLIQKKVFPFSMTLYRLQKLLQKKLFYLVMKFKVAGESRVHLAKKYFFPTVFDFNRSYT